MSDMSLYSGLYETIRRWADLVDDALINLKTAKTGRANGSFDELRSLFLSLATNEEASVDFSDRRVAAMVEGKLKHKIDWQGLANQFQGSANRASALPELEAIADCLADRHAATVAKMRSGLP